MGDAAQSQVDYEQDRDDSFDDEDEDPLEGTLSYSKTANQLTKVKSKDV